MVHAAVVELGPAPLVAFKSVNTTVFDQLLPGMRSTQLFCDIFDTPLGPLNSICLPDSSSELMVYQKVGDTSTPGTQPTLLGLLGLHTFSHFSLWAAISAVSVYVLHRMVRKANNPEAQAVSQSKFATKLRKTRRSRRNMRAANSQNALCKESATLQRTQPKLDELDGDVVRLTHEVVVGSVQQTEGAPESFTMPVVYSANERALLEVLRVPALWDPARLRRQRGSIRRVGALRRAQARSSKSRYCQQERRTGSSLWHREPGRPCLYSWQHP